MQGSPPYYTVLYGKEARLTVQTAAQFPAWTIRGPCSRNSEEYVHPDI